MAMTENIDAEEPVPGSAIADHPSTLYLRGDEDLQYPFEAIPEGDQVVEVADGILWARIPLPWSLDHINVYLLDEGDNWTLVDTGAQGERGRDAWKALEAIVLKGKPINHVVCTHMHPDHLGLAGWIAKRHGSSFSMTQGEYLLAQHLWMSGSKDFPEEELKFLFKSGVSRDYEEKIRSAGFGNFKRGVHELPYSFNRLEDGSIITMGRRQWRVVVGRGHSPEHACLHCLDEPLFLSGDQILPRITANVSVYAREPMANPLAHWITSLDRMHGVEGDPLVLPSHGRAFKGLSNRLNSLIASHDRKLKQLHAWCQQARTPVETFPAMFRRKVTGFDFFMALGEAIAHLHLLESLGLVQRTFDGEVYRFKASGTLDGVDFVQGCRALPGIPMRPL